MAIKYPVKYIFTFRVIEVPGPLAPSFRVEIQSSSLLVHTPSLFACYVNTVDLISMYPSLLPTPLQKQNILLAFWRHRVINALHFYFGELLCQCYEILHNPYLTPCCMQRRPLSLTACVTGKSTVNNVGCICFVNFLCIMTLVAVCAKGGKGIL